MSYDSYWLLGIATTFIVLGILIVRAYRRKQEYSYNYHPPLGYYQHGHPTESVDNLFTSQQTLTDFRFFENRFKRDVDNLLARCERAEQQENYQEAIRLAYKALSQVDNCLGRNHWYAIKVLTKIGYLHFREGELSNAKTHWQYALEIAGEWPGRLREDVCYVEVELGRCKDMLGF